MSGQRIERLFRSGVGATWRGRYVHWDDLQEAELPAGLAAHEWWIGTKLVRQAVGQRIGRYLLVLPPAAVAALHALDRPALPPVTARDAVSAAIAEAVASAQLAGAEITAEAGKRLLRDRRAPRTADEQLVADTFAQLVEERSPDEPAPPGDAGPVHPVVAAILAHLAAADRRAGRAAFYRVARAAGYDDIGLLAISPVLRRDPEAYERALAHVASDDDDATYFVLQQLEVLTEALTEARQTLQRRARELAAARELAPRHTDRQAALLQHALAHPGADYTIEAHRASHAIVYETARADLRELEQAGLLYRRKRGRAYAYTPAPDLAARLRNR